jgi:hypothetical protein
VRVERGREEQAAERRSIPFRRLAAPAPAAAAVSWVQGQGKAELSS